MKNTINVISNIINIAPYGVTMILVGIIVYKYHQVNDLEGAKKYIQFIDTVLDILLFLLVAIVLISIIYVYIIAKIEGDVKAMELSKDIFTNVGIFIISSAIVSVFVYYKVFKDLPKYTEASNKGLAGEHNKLTVEHNRLTSEHNKLTSEHNTLSKKHTEMKQDLRDLIADMNRRHGSDTSAGEAIKLSEKIQATLIAQSDRIVQLIEENADLRKQIETLNKKFAARDVKNKYQEADAIKKEKIHDSNIER